jgi:hypothetical protein
VNLAVAMAMNDTLEAEAEAVYVYFLISCEEYKINESN